MAGPRREKRFDCSMDYASKDIRNILVAGHAGCGKTTLTEALLYMSGAIERMGRVEAVSYTHLLSETMPTPAPYEPSCSELQSWCRQRSS